ncbi:MAG TPA: UbiX family flavin prenyltransferase, partial [Thermoplasmata archaeon]|nr:UbiX family flavin prenyltransferase [Thermoplasmata archaeon]
MAPKKGRGTGTGTTARLVLGISGASGAAIGVRVAHALSEARVPFDLVISHGARAVLQEECGIERGALEGLAECAYEDSDLAAPIASGSHPTRGMAIVPCSSHTVAKIALGLADTLLTRAAHVHLKERRPLVLVPRETPLDAILLRHMSRLAELGAVLLIAAPPYYHRPKSVNDQTDFLAGK